MNLKVRSAWVLTGGLALFILGFAGHALHTAHPSPPLRVYFASAGGPVLFPHGRHAEIAGPCAACHHELASGQAATGCLTCHHEGSFDVVEWKDASMADAHAEFVAAGDIETCLGCHTHTDLTAQPLRAASQAACAQCHEADFAALRAGHGCSSCHAVESDGRVQACRACHQSGEGEARTCEACHAGSGYSGDMMAHVDLAAIEGHTCASCHVAIRGADAIHHACNRCHLDLEKGTFFTRSTDDAATVCRTCHMK
jgi:hypothetical protein